MQSHGSSLRAHKEKKRADNAFRNLGLQIVECLPNLRSLHVMLDPSDPPESLVPNFRDTTKMFGIRRLDDMSWLQPVKVLTWFKKLDNVAFELKGLSRTTPGTFFLQSVYESGVPAHWMTLATQPDQLMAVTRHWVSWYESLHRSLNEALRRIILVQDQDQAWQDHLKVLEKYQRWRFDPMKQPEQIQ